MDDLKPCPFCGGNVRYWYDIEGNPRGVICSRCRIFVNVSGIKRGKTFGDEMKQIAERWNRRKDG